MDMDFLDTFLSGLFCKTLLKIASKKRADCIKDFLKT